MTSEVFPPRMLAANFSYEAMGGMRIPTAEIRAGIFFLAWGLTDNQYITHVDGGIEYETARLTPNNVTATSVLLVELANGTVLFVVIFIILTPSKSLPLVFPQSWRTIQRWNFFSSAPRSLLKVEYLHKYCKRYKLRI
jgi:hypothetical protein